MSDRNILKPYWLIDTETGLLVKKQLISPKDLLYLICIGLRIFFSVKFRETIIVAVMFACQLLSWSTADCRSIKDEKKFCKAITHR